MHPAKQELLQKIPGHPGYHRESALDLVSAARGLSGESWPERQLAVLMLEHQLLRLDAADLAEFDLIFVALGLKARTGLDAGIDGRVLQEGFSCVAPGGFAKELRARLARLNRVHWPLGQNHRDAAAWNYFLRAARDVSKLFLARYVFSADEVIAEVCRILNLSRGTSAGDSEPESADGMPDYEASIVRGLCAGNRIYWVSERCGSELNSLVEYPLTTAVAVIKPPGSDLEIELKRAGTRGSRLLNVIAERNGKEAPASHRLFGGSLGWLAQREASSSARFAGIFRRVHGIECPLSQTISRSAVVTVPGREGETHLLDYLTEPGTFGHGFDEMRRAMALCVSSFPGDTGVARASWNGEAGLTLRFIGQALPQQAIIAGSSSFRLDRVGLYLSERGPAEYFGALDRRPSDVEMRWLADSVLEEILGRLEPPPAGFISYAQYLHDAFAHPPNRARADANYLSVMRQTGECWGTLLALHGYTDGESFVQRNVGLRSIWKDGDWRVRIIFMDHDDLTFAGSRYSYAWPAREIPGMLRDQVHILGGPLSGETIPGDVGALQKIFRTDAGTSETGVGALHHSLRAAWQRTQTAIDTDPALQSLFYPGFARKHRDLDSLVSRCLESNPDEPEAWKPGAAAWLRNRDYGEDLIGESIQAVAQFRGFFERMRFLYSR